MITALMYLHVPSILLSCNNLIAAWQTTTGADPGFRNRNFLGAS